MVLSVTPSQTAASRLATGSLATSLLQKKVPVFVPSCSGNTHTRGLLEAARFPSQTARHCDLVHTL